MTETKSTTITHSNLRHRTRLACGLIPLLNFLETQGKDPRVILAQANIRTVEFLDPAFTITLEKELDIIDSSLSFFQQEARGLELAKYYHLHNFSVLGLAIRACSTLADVFALFRRYPRLQWGICETSGELKGDELIFTLQAGGTELERFLLERDMACVKTLLSEAMGDELLLNRVQFAFPEPADKQVYNDFFNCPVSFNATHSCFSFHRDQMQRSIPTADALSLSFYEAQCARLSAEIDEPFRYTHLVRDHLMRLTPIPSFEVLAVNLNIEPRTLQRLLKKESETFSSILKSVRIKRAYDVLQFSNLSHERIAEDLGFNDAVAFSHAFKQWAGVSPRQWLKTSF